ncbi:MAG: CTP synthase (glutamine hydrolyzing), partial [Candidatus Aenigmarchaeota archaeon]|nr:CTP synthase (glutamine hydrolyzing) [Candidatus Aenigmarchaeota archaeon]MDI6722740.1 CTP synthase (glutamine hydrolyzing) [Candidatus Aenigmarchaeota archaeon]
GVISGVGKGVATASIGKILQEYGFSVTAVKIDPYLNYDAGTLRPTEHGEVWVTDDGGEIDQDLGNYERFLGSQFSRRNNITTGQIYKEIIDKERKGEFLGQTISPFPFIPNEIKFRIRECSKRPDGTEYDFVVVEIGGTIGDYENVPFLFAMKSFEIELGKENVCNILVSYLPVPPNVGEMKTKPTQQAIRMLNENGIFPDFVFCRSTEPLDEVRKKKIETYANIPSDHIISAPDIKTIYRVPLNFEAENFGYKIMKRMNVTPRRTPSWAAWKNLVERIENPSKRIKIAMVGKYVTTGNFSLADSYISINNALSHAGATLDVGIDIDWVDSKHFEKGGSEILNGYDSLIIPGGFGGSGVEGKINAINFARENSIPFLGLCYGMQLAVVEFARNVCNMSGAHTSEVDPKTKYPVIDVLPAQKAILEQSQYGGTMRLGAYAAVIEKSKIMNLYAQKRTESDKKVSEIIRKKEPFRMGIINDNDTFILERHRHRYEVNPKFICQIKDSGMLFPGIHRRQDGTNLMEFIELPKHPYFVATQAHPEFKSRLDDPAPLFLGFVKACVE